MRYCCHFLDLEIKRTVWHRAGSQPRHWWRRTWGYLLGEGLGLGTLAETQDTVIPVLVFKDSGLSPPLGCGSLLVILAHSMGV